MSVKIIPFKTKKKLNNFSFSKFYQKYKKISFLKNKNNQKNMFFLSNKFFFFLKLSQFQKIKIYLSNLNSKINKQELRGL